LLNYKEKILGKSSGECEAGLQKQTCMRKRKVNKGKNFFFENQSSGLGLDLFIRKFFQRQLIHCFSQRDE
jgi:hypothetical protein